MRVVGEFNNISASLREKIKPLEKGKWAEYQILEKTTIQDPVTLKKETFYPHRQFHARDTIFDRGKGEHGSPVEIGVIAQNGVDPTTHLVTLVEKFEFANHRDGILYLSGDIMLHRELHEHLQLRNDCDNGALGDDRDASVPLLFRFIDRKKEAVGKNKLREAKAQALTYINLLDAEDVRDTAASFGWDFNGDVDELKSRLGDEVEKDPMVFKSQVESPDFKRKAIIGRALGKKIFYDPVNHSMKWPNGELVASMERREGENEVSAFARWLSSAPNGDKILARLRGNAPAPATT